MAKFTYEDFEREAQAAGLLNSFSAADLKLAKDNPDAGISIFNLWNKRKRSPEIQVIFFVINTFFAG